MGRVAGLNLTGIGQRGLARDFDYFSQPMPPDYALTLDNLVYSTTGQLGIRFGFTDFSSAWSSGTPLQIFEYLAADGTSRIIASTSSDLFEVTSSTKTSRKGALTPSAGDWKFVNFNGKVLGWQASHTPIVKTGAGNFAAISVASGTLPDGNAVAAAFGRVWGLDDDKQTIRYSALLDETKWAVADGGGVIDMRSVWTQGMDEVVAIESFGSNLVVFGRRHIIIWADGSGSQLGLSPLSMYVTDTIDNVGAVNRNAVAVVGEIDVIFWSASGIRSLVRTMQERATPVNDLLPKNRLYVAGAMTAANAGDIRMAFFPRDGFLLVRPPSYSTTVLALDVRNPSDAGELRMTSWSVTPTAMAATRDGKLLVGFTNALGDYSGFRDFGAIYAFTLISGWIDIRGEDFRKQALKELKGMAMTAAGAGGAIAYEIRVDFDTTTIGSATISLQPDAVTGEFRAPLGKTASYIKIYLTMSTTTQSNKALGALALYTKPLRLG